MMEWPCPSVCLSVRSLYPMQDIACERDILKTACRIDFIFWYGLNTTKTSDAIDLGHSTKTKMTATSVWRLTLYPIQNIACERDILKTACRINFTFDMTLIPLRPRTLLIWGILRKPIWPPQQFEDWHCTLYRILLVNAISWKPLVRLTSHFDMALIPLRLRTLLIWGIIRKPKWPPQQFED